MTSANRTSAIIALTMITAGVTAAESEATPQADEPRAVDPVTYHDWPVDQPSPVGDAINEDIVYIYDDEDGWSISADAVGGDELIYVRGDDGVWVSDQGVENATREWQGPDQVRDEPTGSPEWQGRERSDVTDHADFADPHDAD